MRIIEFVQFFYSDKQNKKLTGGRMLKKKLKRNVFIINVYS